MTRLALQHGAINLSQGFPDFDTHTDLKDLVAKYIRAGYNQYAPMPGVGALRKAIAAKTRQMYGVIYDPESEITITTGGTQAIYAAVTATVYEHIVFDGLSHQSMSRHPELRQRSFVVNSFAKTYHTTGWKVGYCLAPRPLSDEFRKVHQYMVFAVNTPVQHAYAEFLEDKQRYLSLPSFYQSKRDRFLDLIRESRFRPLPCCGTYYQLLDYSKISNESELQFAHRLTMEHGVAAIPPSVFYHRGDDHKVLRICFAKREETLNAAAERLASI